MSEENKDTKVAEKQVEGEEKVNQENKKPDGGGEEKGYSAEDLKKAAAEAVDEFKRQQEEKTALDKLPEEERRRTELELKEKELLEKELLLKAGDILSERELPVSFKAFLTGADEKATEKNIDAFEAAYRKAVEGAVNDRLKGSTPKAGEGTAMTKEQFKNMSYSERAALYKENPTLYSKLSE